MSTANSGMLNKLNKFQKWNKTPQFSELWAGRISTYDDRKQKIGGERRQLITLGPEWQKTKIPFSDTELNLSNIGRLPSVVQPDQIPIRWDPGVTQDTFDLDFEKQKISKKKKLKN